jgi:hypothetical protein
MLKLMENELSLDGKEYASMTPSEKFEFDYGHTRIGEPVRFQEEGRELQAEAFELLIEAGDNSSKKSKDREIVGEMVLTARAIGYRLIGTCTIPGITSDFSKNSLTSVQVYLERPVSPTSAPNQS